MVMIGTHAKKITLKGRWFKTTNKQETNKQADGRTLPIALPSPLAQSVNIARLVYALIEKRFYVYCLILKI